MTKSEFISQVAHMAVERKVNKGRNITDFMNRYWPDGIDQPPPAADGGRDELAKMEAAPYHETSAAREMAFKNGWDACLREKQNSFLPVLEENYLSATRVSDTDIDEIFPAKNKRDAVIETYQDLIAIYKSSLPAAGVAEPGMRWVKASERLPEVGKAVIVRTDDRCITTTGKVFENSEQWQAASNSEWYFDDTEWLDESAPSAPSPVGVTREDAVEWLMNQEFPYPFTKREVAMKLFDYLQGKAITPADPGSQVEAVGAVNLLEWVDKESPFTTIGAGWYIDDNNKTFTAREVIALYKQSL